MIWDGKEKRSFVRIGVPCRIILNKPNQRQIDTITINISEDGLCISLTQQLELFSTLDIEIYKISIRPIICTGTVIWINTIEATFTYYYTIGIQFTFIKPADIAKIKRFLASSHH